MPRTSLVISLCSSVLLTAACSGQDRAPPQVPGVELERLTQEELNLYRRVLTEELSPCGGRVTLDQDLRQHRCDLSPLAARYVAYRVEENDTREEISERYLSRYGAAPRHNIDVAGSPILGEENAPVTLVVFSDFQCPHCAAASKRLRTIVEESQGRVRLVYKSFPLQRQRGSMAAAIAGLAAHRQGRFWQLHDLLFENRNRLNDEVIQGLAEEAGLEMDQFDEDLLDPAIEAQINSERELGQRLGVEGTPTIFINGRRHDETFARLPVAIEEELVRAQMNQQRSASSEQGGQGGQGGQGTGADSPQGAGGTGDDS